MTSACRPLTVWRHLAALLCAVALFVPGPAGAQPCTTCARTSLGLAPRSYSAGDAPVAAAARSRRRRSRGPRGRERHGGPLASQVRVLLGGPNGFEARGERTPSPRSPRVAIADFDTDGRPDVVVALSDGGGLVQVLRNTGGGNLNPVPRRLAERRHQHVGGDRGRLRRQRDAGRGGDQRGLEPGLRVPGRRQRRPRQRPHHARRRRRPAHSLPGSSTPAGSSTSRSPVRPRTGCGSTGAKGNGKGTARSPPARSST